MTGLAAHTLITHSGSFHADDLLAFVLLRTLQPEAGLLRTRDAARIEAADAGTVVFDVGMAYAPEGLRYDHHQPSRARRPEGLAYSAFGLVWRHHGQAYVARVLGLDPAADAPRIGAIHARLDATLVRDIDAVDNGELQPDQTALMHPLSLPNLLMAFRPAFDDDAPGAQDQAFLRAASVADPLLRAQVESTDAALRARTIVEDAIATRADPRWIELPRKLDYLETILALGSRHDADRIRFVVAPAPGEWQLNTVNRTLDGFAARQDLPAAWAGLRGEALAAATGVPDATFCHAKRFIAIAQSRHGALALLEQALAA
ncbi:hypothetical protein Rumeso_03376 [Rubellimicrobium mesophilum DSM 19309]|uniref:Metal-dependent hydrolase n=1 Tax=Rubellimicrobium mesophilum DSM 19309 TaxID=442562 RepID=A0A017HLP3_9RHOB|nr:MYG1 family protein [Rubellimicrobium mesophilum]EYD75048.1 hypothetical protein Rumeso_03376 [Rubellimicrobium mesophilum DSM 19309]